MGFDNFDVFFVTRAYQTRHGNGPMTNEEIPHNIKKNPNETNQTNKFQGEFRRTILDLDLLKYSINSDAYFNNCKKYLCMTCLDHVENEWKFTYNNEVIVIESEKQFIERIEDLLKIEVYIKFKEENESMKNFQNSGGKNEILV